MKNEKLRFKFEITVIILIQKDNIANGFIINKNLNLIK